MSEIVVLLRRISDFAMPDIKGWRVAAFICALLIYGIWGTPTPEQFGLTEISVGLLLVLSVGVGGGLQALDFRQYGAWRALASLLLLYGVSLPVIGGLLSGNHPAAIIRDIIPFLFFLLPLFLTHLLSLRAHYKILVTLASLFIGLSFSVRVLMPFFDAADITLLRPGAIADPFYFANAPTVLFTALILLGGAGYKLYRVPKLRTCLLSACLLVLAALPFIAMAIVMQRASIGYIAVAILFLLSLGILKRPIRTILPALCVLLAIVLVWPFLKDTGEELIEKTSLVGFNMRWQEHLVVIEAIATNVWSILFGNGWGATIASPAVGGMVVNFTHSLITSFWLKTGLIGVCLAVGYLFCLGLQLWKVLFRYPVVAVALAGPFLIDVLLYASFKSLDFGIILLLIALWAESPDLLQNKRGYSIQEELPNDNNENAKA